jgi:polyisoprenoid-binding protein YceI
MRHDLPAYAKRRLLSALYRGRCALTGRSTAARGARPARTTFVATVLLSVSLLLTAGTPGAAQAAPMATLPDLAAVAMDENPPADPAAAPDPTGAPGVPPDGLIHLRLVPGQNQVQFVMQLRTLLQPPRPAACTTNAITGEIVLTPDAVVVSDVSKIAVDMKTLNCAPPLRNNMAQQELETSKYPTAEFVFQQAPGISVPLPIGDTKLQFVGQQTVHGVTRPAQYETAATFSPNDVTGHATTEHSMSAFGLKPPSIPPLIQVQDGFTVSFDFHASISGA